MMKEMKQNTQERPFLWGVNAHNRWHTTYAEKDLEQHLTLTQELGCNLFRFNMNPMGDSPYFQSVVDGCARHGLQLMLVADDAGPAPDSDGYAAEQEPAYIQALVDRAVDTVRRYPGGIAYYQIFNEVDIPCLVHGTDGDGRPVAQFNQEWLQVYARRIKAVNDAIKAAAPQVKTLVNISYKHSGLFDYLAAYEGGVAIDVLGLDWYSEMGDLDEMLTYLEKYGKDVLICELNYWDGAMDKEQEQAKYLLDMMDVACSHPHPNLKGLFFYELLDEPSLEPAGSYNREAHFGLVRYDEEAGIGPVKPAYTAVQKKIASLKK